MALFHASGPFVALLRLARVLPFEYEQGHWHCKEHPSSVLLYLTWPLMWHCGSILIATDDDEACIVTKTPGPHVAAENSSSLPNKQS